MVIRKKLPDGWPKDPNEGVRHYLHGTARYVQSRETWGCPYCWATIEPLQIHLRFMTAESDLIGCSHACLQKAIDRYDDVFWSREKMTKKDIAKMF